MLYISLLQKNLKPKHYDYIYKDYIYREHECIPSSAGCSPPIPPVNGSVSGFTSSRVGAQVTYHCDTDLVLVGQRVATCSQSSLQWLPSSEDVNCVPVPPLGMSFDTITIVIILCHNLSPKSVGIQVYNFRAMYPLAISMIQ